LEIDKTLTIFIQVNKNMKAGWIESLKSSSPHQVATSFGKAGINFPY
jgi:hypothetical protein